MAEKGPEGGGRARRRGCEPTRHGIRMSHLPKDSHAATGGPLNTDSKMQQENPPRPGVSLPPTRALPPQVLFGLFTKKISVRADTCIPPPASSHVARDRQVQKRARRLLGGPLSAGPRYPLPPSQLQGWGPRGAPAGSSPVCSPPPHPAPPRGCPNGCLDATSLRCLFSCKPSHVPAWLLSHLCSACLNIVCDREVLIWLYRETRGCGGTFNWLPAEQRARLRSVGAFCSLPLEVLPFSRPIHVLWSLNSSSTS